MSVRVDHWEPEAQARVTIALVVVAVDTMEGEEVLMEVEEAQAIADTLSRQTFRM